MAARSPKKILFFEANEDGSVGGSHQAQFDLIRHLDRNLFEPVALFYEENRFAEALRDLGVEVFVWTKQREKERRPFQTGASKFAKAAAHIGGIRNRWRFLRSHKIDLLHDNNAPHGACDDWLPAARAAGIPAVTSAMGPYRRPPTAFHDWLAKRWTKIIAISDFIEDGLIRDGFGKEQVERVYLGVDIEEFRSRVKVDPQEIRSSLDIKPSEMMVAMTGNVRRWKGQAVVLDALCRIDPADREHIRMVFVGGITEAGTSSYSDAAARDAEFYSELQSTVAENHLENCVQFTGSRTDVADIMNAADVALHASTRAEPFGLVVVEAMALGKPVVAADKGGPAEVITPGTGLTFSTDEPQELAGHLTRLLEDPELRRELGEGARKRVESFTTQIMTDEIEVIYKRLLNL